MTERSSPIRSMATLVAPPTIPRTCDFDGQIKWFDATRGFGFVVSDEVDGDILVHFSRASRAQPPQPARRGGGRRAASVRQERGLQASRVDGDRPQLRLAGAGAPGNTVGRSRRPPGTGRRRGRVRAGGGQVVQSRQGLWLPQSRRGTSAEDVRRTSSCTWKPCAGAGLPTCSRGSGSRRGSPRAARA